ncbi:MAG: hypothetical protein U5K55_01035 [Aliarcobacter sp.]|nr:hypothetical protein [Aliarcobacter sp.]
MMIPYNINENESLLENNIIFKEYKNKRKILLKKLNISDFTALGTSLFNELEQGKIYKLIYDPKNINMVSSNGVTTGLIHDGKQIIGNAKFAEINPNILNAIGTQVILLHVLIKLNEIDKKLDKVFVELDNDRKAEISAGIEMIIQAKTLSDKQAMKDKIHRAIDKITVGIEKLILSLNSKVDDLPTAEISFFDNWGFKNKNEIIKNKFEEINKNYQKIIQGIKEILEAYIYIEEYESSKVSLKNYYEKLKNCNLEKVFHIARFIPINKNQSFPEEPYKIYLNSNENLFKEIDLLNNNEKIEIEFKLEEIMEYKK